MESAKQQVPAFEDSPAPATTTMIRTLVNQIHLHPYQLFVYLASRASQGLRTREDEDEVSSQFLLMAIANACRIPTPFCAELTEFDLSNESEETFTEDEELEQLLNGDICFKIHIPQMQIERLYTYFLVLLTHYTKVIQSYWKSLLGKTVIIYNKPFFYKKAELLQASAFVISADTAVKLLNVFEDFNILDVLKACHFDTG